MYFYISTVRYGTVRYGTVQYGTVQYSTVQYSTVQYFPRKERKCPTEMFFVLPSSRASTYAVRVFCE